ncbi:MAG TPA: tetratricopeptide repeat protein, partial [Alphaproteobacteria bacterium]|nr:tetratricopeptide repeat protein [Alphaproteobacteria bacterium]
MLDQVSLVRRRVRELPERGLMPRFDISEPGPDQFKVRSWRDWISERASAVLKYSYIGIAVSFVYAVLFNLGNFYFIDINTIWLLTPADYVSSAVSALSLLAVALLVVAAFLVVYVSVLVGIYIVVRILGYAISAAWSRLFSRRGQDETPASQRKTRAWINKLAFIFVVLYVFLLSAAFEYFLGYKLALDLLSGRVPTNALGFFALFVECSALFLPTIFLLFYVVWIVPECLEGKISDSQALVARIIPSVILSTLLTLLLVMPIYGAGTLFSKLNELDSGYIRCEPINGSARIPGACFVRAIERGQFMYDPEKMVILFLPRDGLPQLKFPLRINPPEFWVDLPIVDMALATLPRMHRKVHLMVDNSTAADSWTTATLSGVSRLKAVPDAVTPAERVVRGLAFSGEPRAAFAYALGLFANRYRGQAMYFMKAAADKGFAPAATRLAIWLEEGDGVAQDINAGTRYLGIGAKGGNTFAMDWLADHYLNGSGGVARNPEQALYWYTM